VKLAAALLRTLALCVYILQMSEPQLGPVLPSSESVGNKVCYGSVTWQGHEYRVGDSAYFDPDSFTFNLKLPPAAKKAKHEQVEMKPVLIVLLIELLVNIECMTIATDDSEHLSGCYAALHDFTVQTRLNGSRSDLRWRLPGTQGTLYFNGKSLSFLRRFDAAFAKLLWPFVFVIFWLCVSS